MRQIRLKHRLRPKRGRLTFGFANLEAFARFDPAHPTASRFIDEDLNRLWDPVMLDGPRQSTELERARAEADISEVALIDAWSAEVLPRL